jgi:hypothetical protein
MNPSSIRVHTPTSVLFLCGGEIHENEPQPKTLRDAFMRATRLKAPKTYEVILAEARTPLTAETGYKDLLEFESDIARVVALILLFVESPGSLAELGAFSALENVSSRLVAVVDDYYYNRSSFIRNGPLKSLENTHGDERVLVLERKVVGISDDAKLTNFDLQAFGQSVFPAIDALIASQPKFTKLDPSNSGHVILLIVGLCQEYGALTLSEIKEHLGNLGVADAKLSNLLFCAEILKWIKKTKKGNNSYFVAIASELALDYAFKAKVDNREKVRWRADIRAYWQAQDKPRFRAISDRIQPLGDAE